MFYSQQDCHKYTRVQYIHVCITNIDVTSTVFWLKHDNNNNRIYHKIKLNSNNKINGTMFLWQSTKAHGL